MGGSLGDILPCQLRSLHTPLLVHTSLMSVSLYTYLSVCLSVCLYTCMHICLSACLSVCLCLSTCHLLPPRGNHVICHPDLVGMRWIAAVGCSHLHVLACTWHKLPSNPVLCMHTHTRAWYLAIYLHPT